MVDLTNSEASERLATQVQAAETVKPAASRSDVGTVIVHWTTAIATMVCIATGLRIAADALNAPISNFLAPILPQGEVWTVHFIAGLFLFFGSTAYVFYIRRIGLSLRSALKRTVVFTMPVSDRLRWAAVNVVLHWALYALISVMTVTGVLLYLGFGGLVAATGASHSRTSLRDAERGQAAFHGSPDCTALPRNETRPRGCTLAFPVRTPRGR